MRFKGAGRAVTMKGVGYFCSKGPVTLQYDIQSLY